MKRERRPAQPEHLRGAIRTLYSRGLGARWRGLKELLGAWRRKRAAR